MRLARTSSVAETALCVSPCTQIESAGQGMTVPSTATTVRSVAIRTARVATASGSVISAPGVPRGTNTPLGR